MRLFCRAAVLMTFVTLLPTSLSATWSVIAIDTRTGQIVIASATCVPQASLRDFPADGLMDIQAIIVPGVGVAAGALRYPIWKFLVVVWAGKILKFSIFAYACTVGAGWITDLFGL